MLTISTPTSDFGKAFLLRNWRDRGALAPQERNGFVQVFYQTVCGHLEYTIAEHIRARLWTLQTGVDWKNPEPYRCCHDGNDEVHDAQPLTGTLLALLRSVEAETEQAPLRRLIEIHNQVFTTPIRDRIGSELYDDLDALAEMRNIFAHGRPVRLHLDGGLHGKGTLDKSKLKKPAGRLHAAGILTTLAFDSMTHGDFRERFYCDEALRYFYGQAQQVETRLFETMDFGPEAYTLQTLRPLPDLEQPRPELPIY